MFISTKYALKKTQSMPSEQKRLQIILVEPNS